MTNAEICTIAQYIDSYPKGYTFQDIIDAVRYEDDDDVWVAEMYSHISGEELATLMEHTDLTIGTIFKEYGDD